MIKAPRKHSAVILAIYIQTGHIDRQKSNGKFAKIKGEWRLEENAVCHTDTFPLLLSVIIPKDEHQLTKI